MSEDRHVKMQAARVLEHIQTLEEHYGPVISASDARLTEALKAAEAALDRFLTVPVDGEPPAD